MKKKNYFIDTNIIARLYEGVDEVVRFWKKVKKDDIKYKISAVVIEEMIWLMRSFYKTNKQEIVDFHKSLLAMDNIKVVSKCDISLALKVYESLNIKFNDCVIWTSMESGDQIVSYDKEFDKLFGIKRVEPKDLL